MTYYKTLSIDIETYSSVDLKKSGVYKYAESPDFCILLFAYAFDNEEVKIIDIAQGEDLPKEVYNALLDNNVIKKAFNAQFERLCINKFFNFGADIPCEWWECTMVKALNLGLPGSLDKVSKVLKLDKEKMKAGKSLINYFSKPCKRTKTNGQRTRNLPHHDMDRWNLFKEYCKQDVEVERAINKKLHFFTIPKEEKKIWYLDQKINDTGIKINTCLVKNAIKIDNAYREQLIEEAKEITGLENPNSLTQLKKWIYDVSGVTVKSLTKETLPDLLAQINNADVKRVLDIRKTNYKKSIVKKKKIIIFSE